MDAVKCEVASLAQRNVQLVDEQKEELFCRLRADPNIAQDELLDFALSEKGEGHKWKWEATLGLLDVLLAQEVGEAFTIYVRKYDEERVALLVTNSTTLAEVKKQLQLVVDFRSTKHQRIPKRINWKYTWAHNCLAHEGRRLLDGNQRLSELGIGPNSCLSFADYRPPDPRGRLK